MEPQGASGAVDALRKLLKALAGVGVSPVVFTGGVAFSVWAAPRYTKDFDLCAAVPESAVDKLLTWYDGIRVGAERVPALIRFSVDNWDVDLFVVKDEQDRECMRRAVDVDLQGVPIKVVTPEDLLIHKLIKLRQDKRKLLQDAADIRALVTLPGRPLDRGYLRQWLPTAEAELLEQLPTLADDALVTRLMAL